MTTSAKIKGWWGEKKSAIKLWFSLNDKIYTKFHNIILLSNTGTTQIDHLVVSKFGLFIIETKNRKGWIYGSEKQPNWTQVLYKQKHSFQNPLYQTYRQKKVLCELFKVNENGIFPIIYFIGDCEFKTQFPENVRKKGVSNYIKSFNRVIFTDDEIAVVSDGIRDHLSRYKLNDQNHLNSLEARHNSKTHCPKCGNKLVIRTVKKGKNTGDLFWGCASFPRCRYTRNVGSFDY